MRWSKILRLREVSRKQCKLHGHAQNFLFSADYISRKISEYGHFASAENAAKLLKTTFDAPHNSYLVGTLYQHERARAWLNSKMKSCLVPPASEI